MRVLSRGRVLLLVSVLVAVLAPGPSAAAEGDVQLLAIAGDGGVPQYLAPLVQTAAGLVYRNEYRGTTWVDPPGIVAGPEREDRLGDPTVVGDLLSAYDADTATLRWRTVADATLHETVLPAEQAFLTRTATGYLARQGSGPYDLVAVDLLGGSGTGVIGSAAQLGGAVAGPLGAAVPSQDPVGEWRYFPYDGSDPDGSTIQAPAGSDDCLLAREHLYCWSATELTRLPVTGAAGVTIQAAPRSLVETTGGVAYSVADARYTSVGWHQVWVWRTGQATPVLAANGNAKLTADLAPVTDGTAVAIAARAGTAAEAGLYRISGSFSLGMIRATVPQPRTATAIAVGPGRAVWRENSSPGGGILARAVRPQPDGGVFLDSTTLVGYGSEGTALGVSGARVAYAKSSGARQLVLSGVAGDPELDAVEAIGSTVSGRRVLWRSKDADGALAWRLTDLTARSTTPLPGALSYDLWGERLVRLDADGSVWLQDLRTGADPVEIAAAPDGGAQTGTVQVAGDLVAWDVTPADAGAPDPGVLLRDVATTDPAEPVPGLAELHDLSTGYAVGCGGDGGCSPRAVSLADGSVTPVETGHRLAVDGNVLGLITTGNLPAVRALPTYPDAPRLLASPAAPAEVDFGQRAFTVRIASSQVLTGCALEIRDGDGALVRSVPCTPAGNGSATAEWTGAGSIPGTVPDGTYGWRLVAANGTAGLVDYDGSTEALSGTVVVDGPPEVTARSPEPDDVAVSRSTTVTVAFDEPVEDVGTSTFRLRHPDGDLVPAAVAYDESARTATLTPSAPLDPLSRYAVTVSGVTDRRGNAVVVPPWYFSTAPASAAAHCSLVWPTKVVVQAQSTYTGFRLAYNCLANRADHASWNLTYGRTGPGWAFRFESADFPYPDWYVTWPDTAPMGTWSLTPVGAAQEDGNPLPQNSARVQAKYASRLGTEVARSATSLTWSATATQWSGAKHGWTARPRVGVGLFHQAPGATTWKYVKSVTTSSTGRATVTLGSPKAGAYRLTVAETPTVWASYSSRVRGR